MHKSESYNINAVQGKTSKRWLLQKGICLLFEQYIYLYKNEGFKPTSRRQTVAEISAIHRSTLQSVYWPIYILYFNYNQSLVGPTGVLLSDRLLQRFKAGLLLFLRCCDSLISRGMEGGNRQKLHSQI